MEDSAGDTHTHFKCVEESLVVDRIEGYGEVEEGEKTWVTSVKSSEDVVRNIGVAVSVMQPFLKSEIGRCPAACTLQCDD